jgi:UrcA family protein
MERTMFPKTLVFLIAGLAGAPFAANAATADVPSLRVQYADLDLSRDAGVEHLYTRLRHAAGSVCDQHADVRDFRAVAAERTCAARALDRAVAEIRSSRLSARHELGTTASSVAMRD